MRTSDRPIPWLFLLASSLSIVAQGCGGDDPLPPVDCTVEPVGFADVAAFSACTVCHATTRAGTNRAGAPAGVDYDTYEAAVANAERAAIRVYEETMPPVGTLAREDRQTLYKWALCGTPP